MTPTPSLVVVDHAVAIDAAAALALRLSVGYLIRRVRLARGLTQAEVGAEAGMSNTDICRLEWGNRDPRLGALLRVCGSLEVRPSALLRLAEDDAFPLEPMPWAMDLTQLLGQAGELGQVMPTVVTD